MTAKRKAPAPFPSREQLLEFIKDSEQNVGKREIARAFNLDMDQRVRLRRMLKDLEAEGAIGRSGKRRYGEAGQLPKVTIIEVTGTDADGDVLARPHGIEIEGPLPRIYVAPDGRGRLALGPGDRALARLRPVGEKTYEAKVIHRLASAPQRALGIYRVVDGAARVKPVDRRARSDFHIPPDSNGGAEPGELVCVEVQRGSRPLGPKSARVIERLGDFHGPRSISLLAIHDHDIPTRFSEEALALAEGAGPAPLADREDLRSVPLVTIDGEDARDFDDAVWAEPDPNPDNAGGWHLIVAIADVAWYVRPGDALDRSAFARGNSVYFPDRVVPMLPEALSNGWCSLRPLEERPCLAVHLWVDRHGALRGHRFVRALMRSAARLTYGQVQAARDGNPDDMTGPLLDPVITPLFDAYDSLATARRARGVLELDLPERRVVIADDGGIASIEKRERFDSHKLIEEFMICANVAAATALEGRQVPAIMYRVHDRPTEDKMEALRDFLDTLGLRLAKGQVIRAGVFNRILEQAAATDFARQVNEVVLRTQAQAVYAPDNIGHFGLALLRYCHFTSPIRRYADLLIHRALIASLDLGPGGTIGEREDFERIGEHISATERRAATAERDAVDRFTAAFLADRVGATFPGRITGVTRFGLFIGLDDIGGDGLVPISTLPDDYYVHDEAIHSLVGRSTGLTFSLGETVQIRLVEADPITGGMIFELLSGGKADHRKRSATFRPRGRSRHGSGKSTVRRR